MPIRQVSFDRADRLAAFATGADRVNSAAVAAGGLDYSVDDILLVLGGSNDYPATLKVTSIGGSGEVTGVSVETEGAYVTNPTNPVAVVGGTGSGATFNLTLGAAMTQAKLVKTAANQGRWYLFWYT